MVGPLLEYVARNTPVEIGFYGLGNEDVRIDCWMPLRGKYPAYTVTVTHGTYHDFIMAISNNAKYAGGAIGSLSNSHQMGWNHATNVKHTGTIIFMKQN